MGDAIRGTRRVREPTYKADEDLKWLRATAIAEVVVKSLHGGKLPARCDAAAMRALLRDAGSLDGLAHSYFEQRHGVRVIGQQSLLPERFNSPDFTETTPLSVVRRDAKPSDIPWALGRSAGAYIVSDIPPENPKLSRTAVLLPGAGSVSGLQIGRVDSVGEIVTTQENIDELFANIAGHGILTVISAQRSLEASQSGCAT